MPPGDALESIYLYFIDFQGGLKMKKMIILILAVICLVTGCIRDSGDKLPTADSDKLVVPASGTTAASLDLNALTFTANKAAPAAHKKYLNEPVAFMELPAAGSEQQTAVVGNKTARFYPGARITKQEDTANLTGGILLPFGAIIPVTGTMEDNTYAYDGLFAFEQHYNYFYRTQWEGEDGLVFGADLYGTDNSREKNAIAAVYYKQEAMFDAFPPFTGYRMLTTEEKERITRDRIAFQQVNFNEYNLSIESPDDMVALYMAAASDKQQPVFITTDLIAHGLHLFFGKYLQSIEETIFFPRLKALVTGYLDQIAALEVKAGKNTGSKYDDTIRLAKTYFQIADSLLALAPEIVEAETDFGEQTTEYNAPDQEQVLSGYPQKVQEEVMLILNAAGSDMSPGFQYEEDYTQYKPRGHYTKNGILESYFRTMMWFGRLHIYMSLGEEITLDRNKTGSARENALELSIRMLPVAGLISRISTEQPRLYKEWQQLFDPVTALIGMSDDLSFYDLIPFWKSLGIKDFASWNEQQDNIVQALNKAHKELRPPLIAGNSVFFAPAAEGRKPALGWRLFGQRFTYDSSIHQLVSPPRLVTRVMVRGLDIMKVLGSDTAEQLLLQSDYPAMEGLKATLDKLQTEFEKMSPGIWSETYYNRVLYMIKAQATFEPGAGFYFTETPAWAVKSQLSAHGTWAALRHDTILYVKQVYAEMAGGGWETTSRILPVPEPVHYIEPNLNFFKGSLAAVEQLGKIAVDNKLDNEIFNNRIDAWKELLTKALSIVKLEYDDKEVTEQDTGWIRTIPGQIARLVVPPDASYESYTEDTDAMKGAVIADVFTNSEIGKVLEVGIGIPYRLYVALNDSQGKKRIAVGYTFSYYEFPQDQNSRMNNEEWRKLVYAELPDLSAKLPFWAQGITLPARR